MLEDQSYLNTGPIEYQVPERPPTQLPKGRKAKVVPEKIIRSYSSNVLPAPSSAKVVPISNADPASSDWMNDYMKSISSSEKEDTLLIRNYPLKRSKSNLEKNKNTKKDDNTVPEEMNFNTDNPIVTFYNQKTLDLGTEKDASVPQSACTMDRKSTIRMTKLHMDFKTTEIMTPVSKQ